MTVCLPFFFSFLHSTSVEIYIILFENSTTCISICGLDDNRNHNNKLMNNDPKDFSQRKQLSVCCIVSVSTLASSLECKGLNGPENIVIPKVIVISKIDYCTNTKSSLYLLQHNIKLFIYTGSRCILRHSNVHGHRTHTEVRLLA